MSWSSKALDVVEAAKKLVGVIDTEMQLGAEGKCPDTSEPCLTCIASATDNVDIALAAFEAAD